VERAATQDVETLKAIASAFDHSIENLRIVRRIADSRVVGTSPLRSYREFVHSEQSRDTEGATRNDVLLGEAPALFYPQMYLPQFQPMPLGYARQPFSHPDWVLEVKWDGFRALAYVVDGECRLISRNGNSFKSFPALADAMPRELRARAAVLDGEIVCLDRKGKTQFRDLLFRRGEPRFYAFDLLWCDGEDLRHLPLIDRKLRLRTLLPQRGERLLYTDHIKANGADFFQAACEHDLEGVVAKHKHSPYLPEERSTWLKSRNRSYSQWAGREELFERERGRNPDAGWDSCVAAVLEPGSTHP
jgi:bifunctional non-homologous end joining protein LigD